MGKQKEEDELKDRKIAELEAKLGNLESQLITVLQMEDEENDEGTRELMGRIDELFAAAEKKLIDKGCELKTSNSASESLDTRSPPFIFKGNAALPKMTYIPKHETAGDPFPNLTSSSILMSLLSYYGTIDQVVDLFQHLSHTTRDFIKSDQFN